MQYQQGSMHSLSHMQPEQHTPNRNTGSNSIHGNMAYNGGYPNDQAYSPMYHNASKEPKGYWDRQNQYQYNQRAKYEKYDRQQEYKSNKDYRDRQLQKSRQRSQISYHTKNQGFNDKSNIGNRTGTGPIKQISKVIPMKLRCPGRQDYFTNLRVNIYNAQRTGPNAPASITINITDDSNALFLWRFYIPENDFQNLKEQQSLKVDFGGFIGMILQTLGYCQDFDYKETSPITHNHPNFYAILNIQKSKQKAQFKIMQTNKFKQSLHMLLHFIKANDEQLKQYLAEKYNRQKNQNQKLNQLASNLQNQVNMSKMNEQKLIIEFKTLQRQSAEKIESLERRQKQKIQSVQRKVQDKFFKKKQQYMSEQQRTIDDLKTKLEQKKQQYDQLLRSHQNVNQKTLTLQTSSSSLQNQHIMLQTKFNELQQQLTNYKQKYQKLNKQHIEMVSKNTKSEYQITSLQQKNQQKSEQIAQLKRKLEKTDEQLQFNQGQSKDLATQNQSLRKNIQSKVQQIDQLKDTIEQWKAKYDKKKKKNSAYIQVIEKQQAQIQKYQIQIRKLNSQINSINDNKERLQKNIKDKQVKISDLQKQIQMGKQEIQNQKTIIMQMHKQANSNRFVGGATGFSATSPNMGNTYMTSSSTSLKDYSAYGSESRIKYTGGQIRQTSPIGQKSDRQRMIPPPIKKYRQPSGIQNERNRQNSKSPIVNKLNQQQDPEDADRTRQKIGPIKFRK